ncbi:MAG TPA: alpha-E domain-containing protein [Acetobacteraceae bacterium]|nr:alpha-E domain-containing protein [Acetobacteraceae bacterium]
MNLAPPLLARYAESLFWMARYLERVENLARLIEVTYIFESPGRESESWYALVRINADEESFSRRHGAADPDAIKRFYLIEADNPTSIPAAIEVARTNARVLRPLISTEMWKQLNQFHHALTAIAPAELEGDALSRLADRIRAGVQAQTGITEGTFFRDQSWHFLELGRLIERADQTTRLLDIKFHLLVPRAREERRLVELTQWGSVLRAAAGYHAFRRIAPVEFTPADVVAFLLTDASFPRSVRLCLDEIERHLTALRIRYGLGGTRAALERAEEIRALIAGAETERLSAGGLHAFLDNLQHALIGLAGEIGTAFFRDWRPYAPGQEQVGQEQGDREPARQGQRQEQAG